MSYTAGDVMDLAARFLNDSAKSLYSYDTQLPFLQVAQDDLESELLDNGVIIQNHIDEITVAIGALFLTLPCDFFLPVQLQERLSSSTNDDDYVEMLEKGWEPSREQITTLDRWVFRNNKIMFVGATTERTVRLEYRRTLAGLNTSNSVSETKKAKTFLAMRTAAICAENIGRNIERANSLNGQAALSLNRLISIYTKNEQGIRARRRPFRITRMSSTISLR